MRDESRVPLLDWMRGLAAQVIVWHHLAYYGPLSEHARAVAGEAIDWLAEYGRLAVSIFFVIGGYLSARSLARRPPGTLGAVARIGLHRYGRIAAPYLITLLVAMVASETARIFMDHPSISAPPTADQVVAHVLLLHDVLGYEALTAGIWYLAIDLQLVLLAALACWLSGRVLGAERGPAGARLALGTLGVASLLIWNRRPEMDHLALYFVGTYVFGMFVAWVQLRLVRPRWFVAYLAAGALANAVELRARVLLAACVALGLMLALPAARRPRPVTRMDHLGHWLGEVSLCLFLVHFPVCLVVNAWWTHHLPPRPWLSLAGMVVAYAASVICAQSLYLLVAAVSRQRSRHRPVPDAVSP